MGSIPCARFPPVVILFSGVIFFLAQQTCGLSLVTILVVTPLFFVYYVAVCAVITYVFIVFVFLLI